MEPGGGERGWVSIWSRGEGRRGEEKGGECIVHHIICGTFEIKILQRVRF